MMENCPLKFRILEVMEGGPMWTDEIVPKLQQEYGMTTNYGRDQINYDIVEMVSAGMLKEGESKIDEDGHYKKDALITQYTLTSIGQDYLDGLKKTVRPQVK